LQFKFKPSALILNCLLFRDTYRSDKDVKVDPKTGFVKTTHGLSVHTNSGQVSKYGGAYKVISMPDELQILQRGKDQNHFEIVPKREMSKENFQKLLNQVRTEKIE